MKKACISASQRSKMLSYARWEEHHQQSHFLEACALCQKSLGHNSDIFMYRGNTPFCSEECREEQMEIDEKREKGRNLSSSMRTHRATDSKRTETHNKTLQTETVAVS